MRLFIAPIRAMAVMATLFLTPVLTAAPEAKTSHSTGSAKIVWQIGKEDQDYGDFALAGNNKDYHAQIPAENAPLRGRQEQPGDRLAVHPARLGGCLGNTAGPAPRHPVHPGGRTARGVRAADRHGGRASLRSVRPEGRGQWSGGILFVQPRCRSGLGPGRARRQAPGGRGAPGGFLPEKGSERNHPVHRRRRLVADLRCHHAPERRNGQPGARARQFESDGHPLLCEARRRARPRGEHGTHRERIRHRADRPGFR